MAVCKPHSPPLTLTESACERQFGGHGGRDDDLDSADTWSTSASSTSSSSSTGGGETFGRIALKNSSGVCVGSSTHTHYYGPVTLVVPRRQHALPLPPVVQDHDQQALPAATQDQQHLHAAKNTRKQPELPATAIDFCNELFCLGPRTAVVVNLIILLFIIMLVITMLVTLVPKWSQDEWQDTETTTVTAVWTPNAPNEEDTSTATQSAIPSSHPHSDSDQSPIWIFLSLICFNLCLGRSNAARRRRGRRRRQPRNQYFLIITGTEDRTLQHAEYMNHNGFQEIQYTEQYTYLERSDGTAAALEKQMTHHLQRLAQAGREQGAPNQLLGASPKAVSR